MIVYVNGEFVGKADACLSPDDRGFLFGDGVYEVLLAEQGHLFEADAHFHRLEQSLKAIRLPDVDLEALREAAAALLPRNDLDTRRAQVYLQVTRGVAPRQHAFPDEPVEPTVYATASAHDAPVEKWERGVRAIRHPDQRGARCDVKSTALLPNVLASQAAHEAGAYEAVLVRDGVVTEGSHSSVLAVFDGTVATHPLTNDILPSVTRTVVLELCHELGIPVDETPIPAEDLPTADEVLLLGTTTGVMPVVQVDDETVADGTPGPVTRNLQEAFRALETASENG